MRYLNRLQDVTGHLLPGVNRHLKGPTAPGGEGIDLPFTTLGGSTASGAALATVVGVLIEVPLMLILVRVCLRTMPLFPRRIAATPELRTTGLTPKPSLAFRRPGPSPATN
ncbi:MAG: hypothetical protein U1D96_07385 [Eubacteriales bacterium]|nr:hypothetical protein [Bacillota bacterium]MBV1726538.1 hypothetical protein [Desulforudis sp.]MDP3051210.1 hypothetical protein [Eubacteriales bacterium]MBU4532647.1 hypothetical protein [Bacillota bacterium]MBU4554694.1 hypothetical protein [Bacillota bacterium]